jgi:hypothetical protein
MCCGAALTRWAALHIYHSRITCSRLQVQAALEAAVAAVLGEAGETDVRSAMRTGTLVTTDNRDWDLRAGELQQRFKQCRAVGEQDVVGWG